MDQIKNDECLFTALWRSVDRSHILAVRNTESNGFHHITDVVAQSAMAKALEVSRRAQDVYFACAEYETGANRTAANASGAWGFWADIDCGDKKANEGKGYADAEQGLAALAKFCYDSGLPKPNILINSGSGIHAYWTLAAFVAKDDWQGYARKLKAVMAKVNFLADPSRTADIASVLRIPGTLNHKYDPPLPVKALQVSDQHIANGSMFAAIDAAHTRLCAVVGVTPQAMRPAVGVETTSSAQVKSYGPLNLEQIGSALLALDPDCDDYTWKFHRICPLAREAKLHPERADELQALARDWSSGALRGVPARFWTTPGATNQLTGEQVFEQVWNRFMTTDHQGRQATVGTLFKHASELGWRYSSMNGNQRSTQLPKPQASVAEPVVSTPKVESKPTVPSDAPQPVIRPLTIETQCASSDAQAETDSETISRLAAMTHMEYGRVRNDTAKRLGVTNKTLDDTVKAVRNERNVKSNLPFVEHEPAFDPVAPALLFDSIHAAIRTFIVLEPEQADAATLWVVQTYLTDVADVSPILLINAPERSCAKTLLQQLLGRLVFRPLFASNASTSALFRSIEKWEPTLMIDEADTFFRDNPELHGMVNAGYKKGGFVLRAEAVGDSFEPKMFPVYGPKCIAGISLQKHLPDSTMSRGIDINMRRKMVHEKVERMRNLNVGLFQSLGSQIARFAQDYASQISAARPHLPDELSDRAQDNWEPLLAIATCAGDEWLKRATAAALKLSSTGGEKSSVVNDLLADIKTVLQSWDRPTIKTQDLLEKLNNDPEMDWDTYSRGKPLTPRHLAKLLEPYGIRPKTVRQKDGSTPKGYDVSDFLDAFRRYLKAEPAPVESCQLPDDAPAMPAPKVAATPQRQLTNIDTFDVDVEFARFGVADTGEEGAPPTDDDTY